MILVVIAEDEGIKEPLSAYFGSQGYSLVYYTHPLKAWDNIRELDPDVVLCHALDFPRHWKLLVKQLREQRRREEAVFILLTPEEFDSEEADKATYLGTNALFPLVDYEQETLQKLDSTIRRYASPAQDSKKQSWVPSRDQPVDFVFTHPVNFRLVSGKLAEIFPTGAVFHTEDPGDLLELKPGTVLHDCTLKFASRIIEMDTTLMRVDSSLLLSFRDFAGGGLEIFQDLIREHLE